MFSLKEMNLMTKTRACSKYAFSWMMLSGLFFSEALAQIPPPPAIPPNAPQRAPIAAEQSGEGEQSAAQSGNSAEEESIGQLVLVDMGAPEVLTLLETLTGKSVMRAQNLPAVKITFNSQKAMSRADGILAIQSLLSLNGIAVTDLGDSFLKVVAMNTIANQAPTFLSGSPSEFPPSQQVFSKLFALQYLSVTRGEVQPLVQPLLSNQTGNALVPFNKSNSLLVTDSLVNLQRVERVLQAEDKPSEVAEDIRFYQLSHIKATDLKTRLDGMINNSLSRYLQNSTSVEVDDRTNQLIVVAHPSNFSLIEQMVESLDIDVEPQTTSEVFYIKHADAKEIGDLLRSVIQGQQTASRNSQSAQSNSDNDRQQIADNGGAPGGGNAPPPNGSVNQGNVVNQSNTSSENSSGGNFQFSEFVTVVEDERSNALVAYGTKSDILQISGLIDRIDILLAQVRIRVLIAEVTLSDDENRGIDTLRFRYGLPIGDGFPSGANELGTSIGGRGIDTTFTVRNFNIDVLLGQATQDSSFQVLSSPDIVTTHNKEATINVAEQRPIITGTTTSTVNVDTTSSQIQRENIGIELKITPLISSDGQVQMEIEQKVENVTDITIIDGNEQPIVATREASSFVTVAHGETIILAGLQELEKRNSDTSLNILGDIPLVGEIFKGKRRENRRRELMIFITPYVLNNGEDIREQTDKSIANFPNSNDVRSVLDTSSMPGSENYGDKAKKTTKTKKPFTSRSR